MEGAFRELSRSHIALAFLLWEIPYLLGSYLLALFSGPVPTLTNNSDSQTILISKSTSWQIPIDIVRLIKANF